MVECDLPKVEIGVRFPVPALTTITMSPNTISSILLVAGLVLGTGFGFMLASTQSPTADMEHVMHEMTASLEGKVGDEFDEAFLAEMIVHHEGAVAMARQVLSVSERAELRSLAQAIITAQEGEIAQMQAWQQAWFGAGEDAHTH